MQFIMARKGYDRNLMDLQLYNYFIKIKTLIKFIYKYNSIL